MLDRRYWGLLALALGAGIAPSACGGDEITKVITVGPEAGTGAEGESCAQPTDCAEGLSCFQNVCVASQDSLVLGRSGDSCQATADCAQTPRALACINNVCTDPATVDAGSQVGSGKKGETCQTRSDCESGLTCIGGVCSVEQFGLAPTDKVCQTVQCQEAADCISAYKNSCESATGYIYQCATYGPTDISCDLVRIYCKPANWACNAGTCDYTGTCANYISSVYACPSGQGTCNIVDDKCQDCQDATDCLTTEDCIANECVPTCEEDRNCPLLWACDTTSKTCVEKGCTTDRECVAYTDKALAKCGADGKCAEPCESDAECANPSFYNFRSCVNGYCQDVGCDTDEECRIRAGNVGISVCAAAL